MLVDWAVFAAAVWGLAFALNKTLFKDRPPSSLAKWSLTGILFIASFVLLGVVKHFRYQHLSEFMGFHIPMNNPFDSAGAFLMSFLFFRLLTKGKKAERAMGTTGTQTLPRAPGSGDKASVSDHPSDSSLIDATYERIDQELQTGNLDRATWTRAQGDAEGDTERTKALYIKYRGQRLLERRGLVQPELSFSTTNVADILQHRISKSPRWVDWDSFLRAKANTLSPQLEQIRSQLKDVDQRFASQTGPTYLTPEGIAIVQQLADDLRANLMMRPTEEPAADHER
jgi:hypothetical protein